MARLALPKFIYRPVKGPLRLSSVGSTRVFISKKDILYNVVHWLNFYLQELHMSFHNENLLRPKPHLACLSSSLFAFISGVALLLKSLSVLKPL